ncbi:MAG: hypothetical protein A2068_08870 [Ignavibacteria bacterium GWB2_35_6b]|nr:MAG: hypothetical protein A2068_08870 [Ignavibacteria bacterium GWB2_35_6b]
METLKDSPRKLAALAEEKFTKVFGSDNNKITSVAPASVILLGDHTHYNDGNILTCSVDRFVCVTLGFSKDEKIYVQTDNTEHPVIIDHAKDHFDDLKFPSNRVLQIVQFLKENYNLPSGFVCSVCSNIPAGLGLGSTSAFNSAFLNALNILFKLNIDEKEIIDLIFRTEQNFIGKIANKALITASLKSKKDKIINYDFRAGKTDEYDFDSENFEIIICDTGLDNLKNVLCKERIEECEVGVKGLRLYIWGIKNLRDVNLDFLQKHIHMLPKRIYSRCNYNVTEKIRVEHALNYLQHNEFEKFAELLNDSHTGLSKDYEISSDELDYIVNESKNIEGITGSKLISCSPKLLSIGIVKKTFKEKAVEKLKEKYKEKFKSELIVYNLSLSDGYYNYSENNFVESK